MTLVTTDAVELATQRIGEMNFTLSNWSTTAEPVMTAGGWFECAGSLYYCEADQDCDPAGAWGGLAAVQRPPLARYTRT